MLASLPHPDTDPVLALGWLSRVRRTILATQLVLTLLAETADYHIHSFPLLVVLLAWLLFDLGQAVAVRTLPVPERAIAYSAALDLLALTAVLALAGGSHSPMLFIYLAYLALLGMLLPQRQVWAAMVAAALLQALVVLVPIDAFSLPPHEESFFHVLGHLLSFDLSAAAITWVVTRLSAELRRRQEQERKAVEQQEVTARLAALGTLTAGGAHELGTPLGAIQLLADEARATGGAGAPLDELLTQVSRCRAILDRLRGSGGAVHSRSLLALDCWIAEWRRTAPTMALSVQGDPGGLHIQGSEQSWRAAIWVALDNARQAGAGRINVAARCLDDCVEVCIEDDGCGLSAENAARAGEPFWTGWGGTGLGLFVSRQAARFVGGDIMLESCSNGARTRITIPTASP